MRNLKALLVITAISLITVGCGGGTDSSPPPPAGPPAPTFFTDNLTGVWTGTSTSPLFTTNPQVTIFNLTQATSGNNVRNTVGVAGTVEFPGLPEFVGPLTAASLTGDNFIATAQFTANQIFTFNLNLSSANNMAGSHVFEQPIDGVTTAGNTDVSRP